MGGISFGRVQVHGLVVLQAPGYKQHTLNCLQYEYKTKQAIKTKLAAMLS